MVCATVGKRSMAKAEAKNHSRDASHFFATAIMRANSCIQNVASSPPCVRSSPPFVQSYDAIISGYHSLGGKGAPRVESWLWQARSPENMIFTSCFRYFTRNV